MLQYGGRAYKAQAETEASTQSSCVEGNQQISRHGSAKICIFDGIMGADLFTPGSVKST